MTADTTCREVGPRQATGVEDLCLDLVPLSARTDVATAETTPGREAAELLHPAERAALSRGCATWAAHRVAGRVSAHRALAALDAPKVPLLNGPDRDVGWPQGWTGSITHCEGYAGAVVARTGAIWSVGLDAEPHRPLPPDVLASVATEAEQKRLRWLEMRVPGTAWERLFFCAKEAVYKAWFPLERCWLGFLDAEVYLEIDGNFVARVRAGVDRGLGRAPSRFDGAIRLTESGIILAVVVVASGQSCVSTEQGEGL